MTPNTLKDRSEEYRSIRLRIWCAVSLMLIMASGLVVRAFFLQVVHHADLKTQSEGNRIHLQTDPPVRGLIYDRTGHILAENRPGYTLTLIPERVEDMEWTLQQIGQLLDLGDKDIERFRKRSRQARPFNDVPLITRLSQQEIALISVNLHRLPGVNIEARLLRHYPHSRITTHTTGYVGRINDRELQHLDPALYSGTNVVGKTGIERFYEKALLGKPGYREVESNAHGRVLRVLRHVPSVPGRDLSLYLDLDLQKTAVRALKDKRGALVALDPKTGGVLALVSSPTYDTNLFVTGISQTAYDALRNDINRPLFNRAIMGEYPPASTIKPFVALAALHSGTITTDYTIFDPGYFQLPGDDHRYRNWKRNGDGWTDLPTSIARSNDTYYYNVAVQMGIESLHDYMKLFGLGRVSGLDIASERPGLVPSPEWKKRTRGQPWYPGETVITGIGQGYLLTTPLQLAVATSIIANRGKVFQPRLVQPASTAQSGAIKPIAELQKDDAYWDIVIRGMRDTVSRPIGTAFRRIGKGLEYSVAGKTGTAQVVEIPRDIQEEKQRVLDEFHRDHGLFVAFAPIKDPQIVVAVIVENNANAPVPVARRVMDAWLLRNSNPANARKGPDSDKGS